MADVSTSDPAPLPLLQDDPDPCHLCTLATTTAQAREIARLHALLRRALMHVGFGVDPRLEAEIRAALVAPYGAGGR